MEEGEKDPRIRTRLLTILLPLFVSFAKHQNGFVIGWSAVLPKIQASNSTSFIVGDEDVKWLISLTGITGMAGTLFIGPLIEFFGPKRVILTTQTLGAIYWLLSAFTPYLSLLYLGRIGLCINLIIQGPLTPIMVAEYSDPKIRGFMLATEEAVVSGGMLIVYLMAQELYWSTATALCSSSAIVLAMIYIFLPESPFWLARNGHYEKAKKSLLKLRFSQEQATKEMEDLVVSIKSTKQSTFMDQIRELKHSRNHRPVILLFAIFTLRETGGQFAIFSYTVYLFEIGGVEMDPFLCTVIVGLARTVGSAVSAILLDRMGRRPIMIGTSSVCALVSLVCGICLFLEVAAASWILLVSVVIYVFSYGLGLGPIPWGLTGEMVPTPVRSVGGSICVFGYSLSVFIMGYLFPEMLSTMGIGPVFLTFSASLIAIAIIIFCWFPETKGKTLNDMEHAFRKKSKAKQKEFTVPDNPVVAASENTRL